MYSLNNRLQMDARKGSCAIANEIESQSQGQLETVEVKTGNEMLDHFEPWYFGLAFFMMFTYCTGMPDMPAFMKRQRHRRSGDAPRIED